MYALEHSSLSELSVPVRFLEGTRHAQLTCFWPALRVFSV